MTTPTIIDVRIEKEDSRFVVTPVWSGVDRSDASWSAGKDRKLAERLAKAMLAGKAFGTPEIRTDVAGKTFVSALTRFRGRAMNADLKKLGF